MMPNCLPGGILLATLLVGQPLCAQQSHSRTVRSNNSQTEIRWSEGLRSVEIRTRGEVEFADDDRNVRRVAPGGLLSIEERRVGGDDRRVEYVGLANGGMQRTFWLNGQRREMDARDRGWLGEFLLSAVRENGIGAEARARRILARRGVNGVLEEITHIRSNGGKRIYYTTLLEQARLGPDALARTVAHLGREINSDGDKAALLRGIAARSNLNGAPGRAFFEAAGTLRSSGDHRRVLEAALERSGLGEESATALLRSTAGIRSDGDKAAVLIRATDRLDLRNPGVRSAFFATTGTLRSSGDHRRVLAAVLAGPGLSRPAVLAVLQSAREIRSDGDKTAILLDVPEGHLQDPQTASAYVATLQTIRSDGDYRRAAARVMRQQGSRL